MAHLVEYVDELIQEIGPRPAGTQQEHQAAEMIAARLDGFGMRVDIEEFPCARNIGWVRALYYALCVGGAALIIFFAMLRVVGVVLVAIGAVFMLLDFLGRNPLFSLSKGSLSQNVVARYLPPGVEPSARSRKVVVLAHYDSARTMLQAAPSLVAHYALLRRCIRVATIVLTVCAVATLVPFPEIVVTVLVAVTGVMAAVLLVALLVEVVNFFMPYNQGANCNGSSIGVLYGLAQALASGTDVAGIRRAVAAKGQKAPQRPGSRAADRKDRKATASAAEREARQAKTAVAPDAPAEGDGSDKDRPAQSAAVPAVPARGIVKSVADSLASPFVSQRPPLSEVEEASRQRNEERMRRLEEQRRRAKEEEGRAENGKPLWFVNAKKNAEKRAERRRGDSDESEIVRSRFADLPILGGPQAPEGEADGAVQGRPVSEKAAAAAAAAGGADGAAAVAAGGAAEAPVPAADGAAKAAEAPAPAAGPATLDEADGGTTAAQPDSLASAERRAVVPVTLRPDFSGLDRQAFKVLPGEREAGGAVIVPAETRDATVGDAPSKAEPEAASAAPPPELAELRNRLHSLPNVAIENTGGIPVQQATLDAEPVAKEDIFSLFSTEDSVVSATGSFVPLGTTGVMKPVGEDLLAYHEEGEIFVPDADDTYISEHYSKTGEYSEPDRVNIPDSRMKSFLGSMGDRLSGRKKEALDSSPAKWLGVDERFDARKEGHDIGSWDNFNEDDDEGWSGGAFGGASFEENAGAMMSLSRELLDKEVWLVALGANESKNAGLANLFANHDNELKSALFVNLLGVGVGDLVFTVSEGNYRPAQTDHRMQSLIASAAQNMAIPIGPVSFSAFSTDGTETLRRGGRAISIMGLGRQAPVGWRWSDDEVSRLKESNLEDTVALLIETIKNS
ncbi:MAG: hypothetical protein LBL86_00315 [Coriobacteriales bacterium]|jgi:hypothetical protein|nr:hypothetical protein [Coriobacteriales bacterium]